MSETSKKRFYEEGNYDLTIFERTITDKNPKYGDGKKIDGLVSVELTFSSTRTATAADDVVDYLNRTSPVKADGTIKLIGFTTAMYKEFYNNIVDSKGAVVLGKNQQSKAVGIVFYNTENSENGPSENMFVLPNVVFELPNLSTTTLAEDDTTIRDYSLTVSAKTQVYYDESGKKDRYTCAILNSEDNNDIYSSVRGTMYIPDGGKQDGGEQDGGEQDGGKQGTVI